MNKNYILFIAFTIIFFSCKTKETKEDKDNISKIETSTEKNKENIVEESKDPSIFIEFEGEPEYSDFLSFFSEVLVPFYFRPTPFIENVFPKKFNKFVDFIVDEELYMIPQIQFPVHEKYTGVFFVVTNLDENLTSYLYIYDKTGEIISSEEIHYVDIGEEFATLNIDQYHNIFELDMFFGRFEEWSYQGDGTAFLLRGHSDYITTVLDKHEIKPTGKITEDIPYLSVTEKFLNHLDNDRFEKAFELQDNPNWGDLENFKSTKAFGGISAVYVDSLEIFEKYPTQVIITCSATYIDTINGSSNIIQNFTLSKKANGWKITDMKVEKFKREEYYRSNNFQNSELRLYNITDEGFDFSLLVVSEYPEDNYDQKNAGNISGHAQFESDNFAYYENDGAFLNFDFSNGKRDIKITEENCGKYRHEDVSFDGNFHISK